MPVGTRYDLQINAKGYMLSRATAYRGRAWQRTGTPDTPGARSTEDARYGAVRDQLDHPEVWDDWSGGYGESDRQPGSNRYHWAENFDTRFPKQLIHCQALQPLQMTTSCNINGLRVEDMPLLSENLFCQGDVALAVSTGEAFQVLYPRGGSGNNAFWEANADASWGRPGPGRGAAFGSFYYVPMDTAASPFWRMVMPGGGGAFGFSQGPFPSNGFAVAGGRLWKFHNKQGQRYAYVQGCADPDLTMTAAGWSATLRLGGYLGGAKDMIAAGDDIYIGMPDGIHMGDITGTFVNVTPDLAGQWNEDNCRDLTIHEGQVVFPHSTGLYSFDPLNGVTTPIGPDTSRKVELNAYWGYWAYWRNLAAARRLGGRIRCAHSYAGWLYAGLLTGSYISHIVAGRNTNYGYQWHTMQRLPNKTRVSRLYFDSATIGSGRAEISPRIWVLTDASMGQFGTGTAQVLYAPIPVGYGNTLVEGAIFTNNYIGSARMDFPATDWEAPSTPKVWRSVDVWADNLASAVLWGDFYYAIDGGTRTLLGTVAKSPKDTLYFPSTTGSFSIGQSIALSLDSFTATCRLTPVWRAVVLRGALRPNSTDEITAVVALGDNIPDRRGTPMRPAATQLTELRALARGGSPVQLVDLAGATSLVNVLAPIDENEVWQEGEQNPSLVAQVKMAVLTFTGG